MLLAISAKRMTHQILRPKLLPSIVIPALRAASPVTIKYPLSARGLAVVTIPTHYHVRTSGPCTRLKRHHSSTKNKCRAIVPT